MCRLLSKAVRRRWRRRNREQSQAARLLHKRRLGYGVIAAFGTTIYHLRSSLVACVKTRVT